LKKVRKRRTNRSSSDEKKKADFLFEVGDNLDIKKSSIDKPRLSYELNPPVLDTYRKSLRFFSQ
jgi:hypothetical protein